MRKSSSSKKRQRQAFEQFINRTSSAKKDRSATPKRIPQQATTGLIDIRTLTKDIESEHLLYLKQQNNNKNK